MEGSEYFGGQDQQSDEIWQSHESIPKIYRGPQISTVHHTAQGDADQKENAIQREQPVTSGEKAQSLLGVITPPQNGGEGEEDQAEGDDERPRSSQRAGKSGGGGVGAAGNGEIGGGGQNDQCGDGADQKCGAKDF